MTTESTSPAPLSSTPTRGTTLLTTCVVSALFAAVSGVVSWYATSQIATPTPTVVLVDSSLIANTKIKETVAKPGMTAEKSAAEGREFVLAMNKVFAEYTKAGIVVINSDVALSKPTSLDITSIVAKRLGVKLE